LSSAALIIGPVKIKPLKKLLRAVGPEDIALMAVVMFLVPLSRGGPMAFILTRGASPGPLKLAVFILICAGFWVCLGTRPVEDGLGVHDRLPLKKNLIMHMAYLGQLIGIPFMVLILSDGDTGIIFLWWGVFAFFSLFAWLFSLRNNARRVRVRHRRYIMIFFTVASAWYATEYLVDRLIVEQGHITAMAGHIRDRSLWGMAGGLLEFIILSVLFIIPYTVMVIFPRVAAGEFEGPGVWARRYGWFTMGMFILFVIKCAQAL